MESVKEAKENIPFTCKCSSFPSPSPLCSSQSWTEQAGAGWWGIKRWTYEFRQVSSGRDEVVCLLHRTQIPTFIYSQSWLPNSDSTKVSQLPRSLTTTNGHYNKAWKHHKNGNVSLTGRNRTWIFAINDSQAILIGIITKFCKILEYLYFKIWF